MVKKSLKPLAKILEWIVFVALMLVFLVVVSPVLPFDNMPRTYSVITGSMEPTIKTGSLVLTKPVTEIRSDQIIAFTSPNNGKDVILHRVADSSDLSAIKTKGDNNNGEDAWTISQDDVLGEYVTGVPYFGNVSMYMRTPVGFLVVIGIPALAIIFLQILNIKAGIEEEVEKRVAKKEAKNQNPEINKTNKVVSMLLIGLGLTMMIGKQVVYAWYMDTVTISGITLSVKDFVAPAVPQITSPDDGYKEQAGDITIYWTEVEDYGNMNAVHYQLKLVDFYNATIVTQLPDTINNWQNLAGLPDGTYKAYVKACDALDNCSDWSDSRTYIVDNIAPPVPTLVSPADQIGNSSQLVQKWTKETDNHGGEVTYLYQSFNDSSLTNLREEALLYNSVDTNPINPTQIIKHDENATDGEVYWHVKAIDEVGNESAFSSVGHFTIDNGLNSSISVTGSPARDVEDRVANGTFDEGMDGWRSVGSVESLVDDLTGSQVVQLVATSDGTSSQLSQQIDNSNLGLRTLGFWYRPAIFETDQGFDDPIFQVFINSTEVYQLTDLQTLNAWQFVAIDLSEFTDNSLDLQFQVANSGDQALSNTIYLDNISTNFAVVNNQAVFTIQADKGYQPMANYRYFIDGAEYGQSQADSISFSLTAQPDDQLIEYWLSDGAGNEEEHHLINVIYDNQLATTIEDLTVVSEADSEYYLSFTSPSDNLFDQVEKYQIKYSSDEITAQNWEQLPSVTIKPDDNFSSLSAPRKSGDLQEFIITGLDDGKNYHFAVRSVDTAHNLSQISNIATANQVTEKSVVINEVMYNPEGDDFGHMPDGEWVELYNLTDEQLDLNGWYLLDEANNRITISISNSDTNFNYSDVGETVISGKGYLVVYRNSSAIFNNDGDNIYLFDQNDLLVDSMSYAGGKQEGLTEARIPDGTGDFVDPISTPGRANVAEVSQLSPQVILNIKEDDKVGFTLLDSNNYLRADYSILYSHLDPDSNEQILDALQGHLNLDGSNRVDVKDLYLGTWSGGICTPHLDVTDISVEIKLTDTNGEELVVFSE